MAKRKPQLARAAPEALESAEMEARRLGNRWLHEHLPTEYTCGQPQPLRLSTWTVPILLAYPGLVLGQVGALTVDVESEQVIQHTPTQEIFAAGDRLGAQHAEAIQAAYLRAREG
jgi:hypothetical protein